MLLQQSYRQFSHPSGRKMSNLVKDAGIKDNEFLKMLEEFPSNCKICIQYKKVEPRPIVGFPLATRFNEVVAMDIKEIRGHKLLHLVDHATRYSVAVRILNKESSSIL